MSARARLLQSIDAVLLANDVDEAHMAALVVDAALGAVHDLFDTTASLVFVLHRDELHHALTAGLGAGEAS